jgi:hypothetical protein
VIRCAMRSGTDLPLCSGKDGIQIINPTHILPIYAYGIVHGLTAAVEHGDGV